MNTLSRIIIAASLALSSQAALADKQADVTVNTLGYRLIDLDLNDGISPEVNFFSTSTVSYLSTYGSGLPPTDLSTYQQDRSRNATAFATGNSSFSSEYTGGLFGSVTARTNLRQQGELVGAAESWFNFTLSPKTELVIFGNVKGHGSSNSGTNSDLEMASGSYFLTLYDANFQGDYAYNFANASIAGSSGEFANDFSLHLANNDQTVMTAHYDALASVNVRDSGAVPQVPEPETYAMLLAGLAALGTLAQRRKQVI